MRRFAPQHAPPGLERLALCGERVEIDAPVKRREQRIGGA
jgi:hypothetical protein